jgi:protein-L-isoaspartate(D-aspartate) O-methyltransferase
MEQNGLETLIKGMEAYGVLRSPGIKAAFRAVDRRDFVPDYFGEETYGDYPLPIGEDQTISQPTTVAFMLELLNAQPGERVLDIGSGSGWTTALLGHIVGPQGEVVGLECRDALVARGRRNIAPFGFKQIRIEKAGRELGMPGEEFDRILVSAAAPELPEPLLSQLKPGGTLVLPVQNDLCRVRKNGTGTLSVERFPGFLFVTLMYNN